MYNPEITTLIIERLELMHQIHTNYQLFVNTSDMAALDKCEALQAQIDGITRSIECKRS